MTELLSLSNASRRFGGLKAVDGVTVDFRKGEIVGLIGPNGAGKSTLINVVTGVHPASSGRVYFNGRDITRNRPYEIARLGLARTFQIVQPFPKMTVAENVAAGAIFAGGARNLDDAIPATRGILRMTKLDELSEAAASTLTLAQRKRLELSKALAMKPSLLLLDEVNAGLNPTEIEEALALIRSIAESGVTIVIVEHLMKVVVSVSQRIIVLHEGRLIADGPPSSVLRDTAVVEAYLGARYARSMEAIGD
jgi:branched-chain amino acid transport system ATP-binding protein